MSAFNIVLLPSALQSLAGPFAATYTKLGLPLVNSPRIIKWTNNSTVDLLLSWDGVTDHEILPAGSFVLLDIAANKEQVNSCYIAKGTQFWVKNTVGGSVGSGSVYMSVYYA
jgi:hypothetical protein